MSELRKDPVTGRWVIISTERRKRPSDFRLESVTIAPDAGCPFCEGHEEMTPRELLAHRNGSAPTGPGWSLRGVPNQFPVLRVEGTLDRQGEGLFDKMSGIGAHEVIIETPRHEETLATMEQLSGRYGFDAALQAMEEATKLGRLTSANSVVLAARLASFEPEESPNVDLSVYDQMLKPAGEVRL